MRQTINGADFRRLVISAAASIEINKQTLNELNVFPVPDGDTGTNMSMTISAAAADLRKLEDPSLEKASHATASAMLRGARGNSGVILSLLLRGISKRFKGGENSCDGVLWAEALQEGVDAAYKAVMKPAEGTILTVARLAAAKAAQAAQENNYFEFVHEAAIEEAKIALANTVNQNPVLKKAGVVDAGGKGWLLVLEGMMSALRGEDVVAPESGEAAAAPVKEQANFSEFDTGDITFSYCTEFIVSRENDKDPKSCALTSPPWATAWFWWMTTRSSRSTSTPTIPVLPCRLPCSTAPSSPPRSRICVSSTPRRSSPSRKWHPGSLNPRRPSAWFPSASARVSKMCSRIWA